MPLGLPPGLADAYMQASMTLPSGTAVNAGVAVGSWSGVPINTLDYDSTQKAIVTSALSTMSIPPGRYWFYGRCPFLGTNNTKTRLIDFSTTTVYLLGSSTYTGGTILQADSIIQGFINLLYYTPLQMQAWCTFNNGSSSSGAATSIPGVNEVYAQMSVWRMKDGV